MELLWILLNYMNNMEIQIQLENNLITEDVIGVYVSDEINTEEIIGEIISYDSNTGIAICELYEKEKGDF